MSDTNAVQQSTTNEGRDSNGRFAKGNNYGTGNPFARDVARLRKRALDQMTDENWDGIFQAMIKKALDGDVSAAKFVVSYCIGKPPAEVHPDKLDFDEWEIYRKQAEMAQNTPALLPYPNSEFSVNTLRGARPEVTMAMRDQLVEKYHAQDAEDAKQAEAALRRKEKREAKKLQTAQEEVEMSAKRQAMMETAEEVGVHASACPDVGVHASACPDVGVHASACPDVGVHASACPHVGVHASACPADEDTLKREHQHLPSSNGPIGDFAPSSNGDTVDDEILAQLLALLQRGDVDWPPPDAQ